jgi:hypothetical protein
MLLVQLLREVGLGSQLLESVIEFVELALLLLLLLGQLLGVLLGHSLGDLQLLLLDLDLLYVLCLVIRELSGADPGLLLLGGQLVGSLLGDGAEVLLRL